MCSWQKSQIRKMEGAILQGWHIRSEFFMASLRKIKKTSESMGKTWWKTVKSQYSFQTYENLRDIERLGGADEEAECVATLGQKIRQKLPQSWSPVGRPRLKMTTESEGSIGGIHLNSLYSSYGFSDPISKGCLLIQTEFLWGTERRNKDKWLSMRCLGEKQLYQAVTEKRRAGHQRLRVLSVWEQYNNCQAQRLPPLVIKMASWQRSTL